MKRFQAPFFSLVSWCYCTCSFLPSSCAWRENFISDPSYLVWGKTVPQAVLRPPVTRSAVTGTSLLKDGTGTPASWPILSSPALWDQGQGQEPLTGSHTALPLNTDLRVRLSAAPDVLSSLPACAPSRCLGPLPSRSLPVRVTPSPCFTVERTWWAAPGARAAGLSQLGSPPGTLRSEWESPTPSARGY